MTSPNGLNGSGDRNNVTSLEEARRRAEQKRRQERAADPSGRVSTRDWIIGGIVILMALAMIATWINGLMGGGAPAKPGPAKTSQLITEVA
ncbi:MAG: hypothetical protein ACKVP7_20820 [Hyphomicrobiaceae bacterium]